MVTEQDFEIFNGNKMQKFTLTDGIEVEVFTLGATLLSLKTPDKNGKMVDVLLGFQNAEDMIQKSDYMGAVVGRVGNRIGDGRFELESKTYRLALNDGGKAHLHGGIAGFNQKIFTAKVEGNSLLLTYTSPDGEEGYPARLTLTVRYMVEGSALTIEYFAKSDGTTIFAPTNHAYFNLNGENDGSILDNELQINADKYLPTDSNLIPTGEEKSVADTPFDFRRRKVIGRDIEAEDADLKTAGGYDHNFCLTDRHFATALQRRTPLLSCRKKSGRCSGRCWNTPVSISAQKKAQMHFCGLFIQ